MRTLLLLALAASPAAAKGVRAGAFAIDVTPDQFPVSVNGGFTDRQAKAANDPLHARCLVLADGTTTLALVVVDSCMMPRELLDAAKADAAKRTGIPASHMLISATHTHTAPTVAAVFGSAPDERYVALLTKRIADGIVKAHANLAPAEVGWAVADEPRPLFNRRYWLRPGVLNADPFGGTSDLVKTNPGVLNPNVLSPAGPTDPQLPVLSVRTPGGKPVALYANYGLHYVGDLPPLSADYFGVFCEKVGPAIGAGPGFVGLLSNGTSGDVNNVDVRSPAAKLPVGEKCRLVAETVVTAARTAYSSAKHTPDATLAVAEAEIELGVRKPSAATLDRAKAILAAAGTRELTRPDEVYARDAVALAGYPDRVRLKLQAVRIGDLGVCAVPCEVFAEVGLELKRRSPLRPTAVVSLANGYNGYLPTPHQHRLGGYETWAAKSSHLEATASDAVVAKLRELLDRVK